MEDIFGKPTVVSNEALKVFFTDNFTHTQKVASYYPDGVAHTLLEPLLKEPVMSFAPAIKKFIEQDCMGYDIDYDTNKFNAFVQEVLIHVIAIKQGGVRSGH